MKEEHLTLVKQWIKQKEEQQLVRFFQNNFAIPAEDQYASLVKLSMENELPNIANTLLLLPKIKTKEEFLSLFKLALQYRLINATDTLSSSPFLTQLEPDELNSLLKITIIHANLENFHKLLPQREKERETLDLATCLSLACGEGHLTLVQHLLTTIPFLWENSFSAALIKATQAKKLDIIEYLLLNGDTYNGKEDRENGKIVGYATKIKLAIQKIPDQKTAEAFITTLERIDSQRYQHYIELINERGLKRSPSSLPGEKKASKARKKSAAAASHSNDFSCSTSSSTDAMLPSPLVDTAPISTPSEIDKTPLPQKPSETTMKERISKAIPPIITQEENNASIASSPASDTPADSQLPSRTVTTSISTVELAQEPPLNNACANSASCRTGSLSFHTLPASRQPTASITDQILGEWNNALDRKDKAVIRRLLEKNQGVLTPNRIKNTFEALVTKGELAGIQLLLSLKQESNDDTPSISGKTRQICIEAGLIAAHNTNQFSIIQHLLNKEKYESNEIPFRILLMTLSSLNKRLALLLIEKIPFSKKELMDAQIKLQQEHKGMGNSPTLAFKGIDEALKHSLTPPALTASGSANRHFNPPTAAVQSLPYYASSLPASFHFSSYLAANASTEQASTPIHAAQTECPAIWEVGDDQEDNTENDLDDDDVFGEMSDNDLSCHENNEQDGTLGFPKYG